MTKIHTEQDILQLKCNSDTVSESPQSYYHMLYLDLICTDTDIPAIYSELICSSNFILL